MTKLPSDSREEQFLQLLRVLAPDLPEPERQYKAIPGRKFPWDFAWPDSRLLVEIHGGTWMVGKSGHTSGSGVRRDCEKGNLATLHGWRCLAFTSDMLDRTPVEVVDQVRAAIAGEVSS